MPTWNHTSHLVTDSPDTYIINITGKTGLTDRVVLSSIYQGLIYVDWTAIAISASRQIFHPLPSGHQGRLCVLLPVSVGTVDTERLCHLYSGASDWQFESFEDALFSPSTR